MIYFYVFCEYDSFGYLLAEAVAGRCSVKKVFLKVALSSEENTCGRVSF